jgi:hypothetical protein
MQQRTNTNSRKKGSDPLVWMLSPAGVRLMTMLEPEEDTRKRYFNPSPYFLKHTLVTAEAYLQLVDICNRTSIEFLQAEFEPECWRYYPGKGGRKSNYKPDMYVVTKSGEYLDHWFIEIDLATESYPTIIEKCDRCINYHKSGVEQGKNSVFPYVLWIVPNTNRKVKILEKMREQYSSIPKLFIVITPDELESLIVGGADNYKANLTKGDQIYD